MTKYIVGVAYRHRHVLLTAYLKVTGRTQLEAERRAKAVGTALHKRMPKEALVQVPRYRAEASVETFEIPVVIAGCEGPAKAELAKLVLQGTV